MILLRSLAILFMSGATIRGQVFLAYQGTDSGCLFLGQYDHGRFIDTTKTRSAMDPYTDAGRAFAPEFAAGKEYTAITETGEAIRVRVTGINPKQDLPTWKFQADTKQPALIMTAPLGIEVVPATPTRLSRAAERQIRRRAKQIWEQALRERSSDSGTLRYSMGTPKIESLGGMLAVSYPLDIEPGNDRRGSMFFLYSQKQNQIIRAEFGHPEWAFGSSALSLRPQFYFRIKGWPNIYFLAEYAGGWEDHGHAIINVRTGQTELYCY